MEESSQITLGDAYRAMCQFLEAYWRRGNRAETDDPIAVLLSDIQFGATVGPTKPADPAQWHHWLDAVRKITR